LLLRYALALKVLHANELAPQVEQLRDRFEASRLRGDRVHVREEARFTLHLLNDPKSALKLAQDRRNRQTFAFCSNPRLPLMTQRASR
jgi:hypothetical protein